MDSEKKIKRWIHPSKDILSSENSNLSEKKIVLCITGSVAAYRAIDLARMLMRHGADVYSVMSHMAESTLLSSDMMKWATGNNVVTKLTGNLEHIFLADYNMSDMIIVYPCTANTLSKIANGIDDTPVTSVLSVALGSKIPIIIAPAMHESMYNNYFVKENIQRLKAQGIEILDPSISEGKAKIVQPEQVVDLVLYKFRALGVSPLFGKRILVTAGSTVEYIDPVRIITNLSSGKMGNAIAEEAKKMGATVSLIYGNGSYQPESSDLCTMRINTTKEMHDAVISELSSKHYDIVILSAAVTDLMPEKKFSKKIDSRKSKLLLPLVPTRKIIDEVKYVDKNIFLVAFKANHNVSDSRLIENAYNKLTECNGDLIVANDVNRKNCEIGSDHNEVFIIDRQKKVIHLPLQSKKNIAGKILSIVAQSIDKHRKDKNTR